MPASRVEWDVSRERVDLGSLLICLQKSESTLLQLSEQLGRDDSGARELASSLRRESATLGWLRAQLQTLLAERLAEDEEGVSEREMRRDNALLEELVRQRTAELAASNARLTESLEQLQEAQSRFLFAERLATIGQLAAGVVHEINNPLAFLLNNLAHAQRVMKETQPVPSPRVREEVAYALSEASDGAEHVRLIVQDLKMLSRPDEVESGSVQLAAVVRSAAKLAAHEIRSRAHLVERVEGVPLVRGNSARLCQVFLNLLLNAAHAIVPGQVERNRIHVMARRFGADRVLVEVGDTGCGIPPELLERIFDPFFTTKPVGVGSGLGLSVCRRIIAAHGGEISVESQPGRGTTFRVFLPVHSANDVPAEG